MKITIEGIIPECSSPFIFMRIIYYIKQDKNTALPTKQSGKQNKLI